jgi:hypothetical protein
MKKISLLLAAIILTGVLYAQHSAETVPVSDNYIPESPANINPRSMSNMGTLGFYTDPVTFEFYSVPIPAGAPVSLIYGTHSVEFYDGDFGPGNVFYAVSPDDGYIYTIDIVTGIEAQHVMLSGIQGVTLGYNPSALSYDPSSAQMFFVETNISVSLLYTVDLNTGICTLIGSITNAPGLICLAIDNNGNAYGVDIVNDYLVNVDLTNANGTVIGGIGFNANYAQGADFDPATGIMYLAAFNNDAFQPELRSVNLNTGLTTFISVLSPDANLHEATAFGIYLEMEVPLSDWALVLAFILIAVFIAIRFYRN